MNLPAGRWATEHEWRCDCPSCGKADHFFLNVASRKGHCKVCAFAVGSKRSIEKAWGLDADEYERLLHVPDNYRKHSARQLLGLLPAWGQREPRAYLKTRGVTEEVAEEAGVMWHPQTGRLAVRATSVSRGMPAEYLVRSIRVGGKWILNNQGPRLLEYGFGHAHIHQGIRGLVLFEGIFDLLATNMLGHGLAICGSHLSRTWAIWLRDRVKKVILWLDPDKAGRVGVRHGLKLLKGMGIETAWVDGRDPKLLRPLKDPLDHEFLEDLRNFSGFGKLSRKYVAL